MVFDDFNRDERKLLNLEKVAFVFDERPYFRIRNVANLVGVSNRTCYRYLAKLMGDVIVLRESRGKYITILRLSEGGNESKGSGKGFGCS